MVDGYPEEPELEQIKNWPYEDREAMIEFIEDIWWSPEFGFHLDGSELKLSTGGWSGNDDIIEAMQKNHIFWMFCWFESRRGGHYIFDLKLRGNG